jgi:hypothetical protein
LRWTEPATLAARCSLSAAACAHAGHALIDD